MIPQRLTLKNFLSYQNATLDFRGLHTACICGANGAGKSSLLEAIAWAVWGQSRAATDDDVIHMGTPEAQVDFVFVTNQQIYRIIRSRHRAQGTSLEFQVAQVEGEDWEDSGDSGDREGGGDGENRSSPGGVLGFRSLTGKSVRATQQLILEHVRLDYEAFINSAYLRQGRADEFMLKRPGERKEILADLLKLGQYDELAERAKDRARLLKGQIELLQRQLQTTEAQLQQQEQINQERRAAEQALVELQQQQERETLQLQTLQATQHQRQTWQQQLTWQQQQQRVLIQDWQRFQQELEASQQQQLDLESLLQQAGAIAIGYHQFQILQAQEIVWVDKSKADQVLQAQQQQYQQQQAEKVAELQTQMQRAQAQLEVLEQQETENQQILSKATDVNAALEKLQQARNHLETLDQLQAQAAPLLQRRQQIQTQLDRTKTRLASRLDELLTSARQLQQQQAQHPHLQQAAAAVRDRIETLEQRRLYQQRVLERGLERRTFMERLQAEQRNYETQLAEVDQKIRLLMEGDRQEEEQLKAKDGEDRGEEADSVGKGRSRSKRKSSAPTLSYPPCPLCDRPLDQHHWSLVLEKHQVQHQEILDQIWVVREQLAASEREIQILRQEYRELDQELLQYDTALEQRGKLQQKLLVAGEVYLALQQIGAEMQEIERSLRLDDYGAEWRAELNLLEQSLQELNYDEKDHALARGDVDRWRWAEIRQAEIRQAQRRLNQITQRRPELEAEMSSLKSQLEQLHQETASHLAVLEDQIAQIGYNLEQHNQLRQQLRDAQSWQLRYQELEQAKQHYPQVQQRVGQLIQSLQERQQTLHHTQTQIQTLTEQLEQTPDCQMQMKTLELQIQERRSRLDEHHAQLGRLQQKQLQLETLSTQRSEVNSQLQGVQRQYRIYQELAQAFGKNGIQALMIENALPQLEAETNQILSRLSANQLHVQFVTQRSNRKTQTSKLKTQNSKLIETLDILIADANGTRPYETYSGGEAFRVNFAIRLALARLLAHRSGTALQMLIVDEGFGTQDAEGCDRLIAAINAIAPDFACILAVTHVPHFKEAFQSRIEVYKTENGSQLNFAI
jgi:exonuclease SbcC